MQLVLIPLALALTALARPIFTEPIVDAVTLNTRQASASRVTLIFARGTTEVGTLGAVVGPSLSSAMTRKFGASTRTQGVPYAADISGAISGAVNSKGAQGAIKMASMAKQALSSGSRVVLSGYSQGAEQVHGALLNLGADAAKITVRLKAS
jgi:cutinase